MIVILDIEKSINELKNNLSTNSDLVRVIIKDCFYYFARSHYFIFNLITNALHSL